MLCVHIAPSHMLPTNVLRSCNQCPISDHDGIPFAYAVQPARIRDYYNCQVLTHLLRHVSAMALHISILHVLHSWKLLRWLTPCCAHSQPQVPPHERESFVEEWNKEAKKAIEDEGTRMLSLSKVQIFTSILDSIIPYQTVRYCISNTKLKAQY